MYLDRKGLTYTVKDADEYREELLKYSNGIQVPVTVIDSDRNKVVEGMNLQRLASLL